MTLRLVLLFALLTPASAGAATPATVHEAIAAGRCRDAAAEAAQALDDGGPPALWRLLGDAHRCLGDARAAALAYRRSLATSGPDPTVEALLRGLRERLGRLVVTVRADRGEVTRVVAEMPDGQVEEGSRTGPSTWVIEDLDPSVRPHVLAAGAGLETTRVRAPAAPQGGQAAMEVQTRWSGLATVELSHPPRPGVQVELQTPAGATRLQVGATVDASPGAATIAVVSERGRVPVAIRLEAGQALQLDPTRWTPTTATVRGVPAGASLRLFLEQVEPPLERLVNTPQGLGEIDNDWGLRLAPVLALDSLVGGPGTLVVSHPTLGVVAMELLLQADADNAIQVDWRSLAEAPALRARYLTWRNRRDAAKKKAMAPVWAGLAAGAGGTLVSIIGWSAAAERQGAADALQAQALAGAPHGEGATGWYDEHQTAIGAQRAAMSAAIGGALIGAAGFTVSGVFGAKARTVDAEIGEWDPP